MDYEQAMEVALQEAELAFAEGEIPVGAVVLRNGEIVSRAHNKREADKRISGHAEILAIELAANALGRWQLDDCQLVVTLEPCPMCAGAIGQARITTLVYGASDEKYGAFSNSIDPFSKGLYPSPLLYRGVKSKECQEIIDAFFKNIRKQ